MLLKLQLAPGAKPVVELDISATASVLDLKDIINSLNKTKDSKNLHCVFKHQSQRVPSILEDDKCLSDYNITEGCTIKYIYQKASTGTTTP